MAAKKHSKAVSRKSFKNLKDESALSTAAKARLYDNLIRQRDEIFSAQATMVAKREAEKDQPLTLSRAHLDLMGRHLDRINLALVSVYELAHSANADLGNSEHYQTAIANTAIVACRRCDVIAGIIGERVKYGNFECEVSLAAAYKDAGIAEEPHHG